jgi:hypothetical protein
MIALESRMQNRSLSLVFLLLLISSCAAVSARTSNDEAEVRGVVERVFQQLKAREYGALYDVLPSNSQSRVTRDRFISMLAKTSDTYDLDRMEIGKVRTSGDVAVVDTVMYGRIRRPIESDAKLVVQQYLVRENGRWRVATGDRATVRRFLNSNPAFAKQFPIREPRAYVKRDGKWVDISSVVRSAARRRTG